MRWQQCVGLIHECEELEEGIIKCIRHFESFLPKYSQWIPSNLHGSIPFPLDQCSGLNRLLEKMNAIMNHATFIMQRTTALDYLQQEEESCESKPGVALDRQNMDGQSKIPYPFGLPSTKSLKRKRTVEAADDTDVETHEEGLAQHEAMRTMSLTSSPESSQSPIVTSPQKIASPVSNQWELVVQCAEQELLTCWKALRDIRHKVQLMSAIIRALSNMACEIDRMPDKECAECDHEDHDFLAFDMFRGINFHTRGVAVDDTDIYWFRGVRSWDADMDIEDVEQYDPQLRSAEI